MSKAAKLAKASSAEESGTGICFVICAIGGDESKTRERADNVFDYLISPVARECGYEVIRSDREGTPEQMTAGIVNHLIEDAMVVADLTGKNPNVYYELAVRHSFGKPSVHIIEEGEELPFDLHSQRTVRVNMNDPRSIDKCKGELAGHIRAAQAEPEKATTPVSVATSVRAVSESKEPMAESMASVLEQLETISGDVAKLLQYHTISIPTMSTETSLFIPTRQSIRETVSGYLKLKKGEELRRPSDIED